MLLLVSFSYAYVLALIIIVCCLISISLYLSIENNEHFAYYLTISTDGLLTIKNGDLSYQLQETSRLGFIGCWLVLQPSATLISPSKINTRFTPTQIFIFRDSLSEQDYSRLVSVIKQLS
ncbi:MAG: hypothetical protein GY928_29190 [Colwellia sp.]|nr:hypothetical protein [Colwellia sp.]